MWVIKIAKINIELPEKIHDELRIAKVKTKKDIQDLIIEYIKQGLKNE